MGMSSPARVLVLVLVVALFRLASDHRLIDIVSFSSIVRMTGSLSDIGTPLERNANIWSLALEPVYLPALYTR